MTRSFEVVAVGSPIMDTLAQVGDDLVASISGEKGGMELVSADAMQRLIALVDGQLSEAPGGSAGNTVFALSRLGTPTAFVGKLGNDAIAEKYVALYQAMGGSDVLFKKGDTRNARCLSLITPDSERTMRTDLGAAMTLSPEEIVVEDFQQSRHVHIEGYQLFNRDLMWAILKAAKAADCTISLDMASFEVVHAAADILPEILENYVDVVLANEEEAAAYFTGQELSLEEMAEAFAKLCRVAVVKLGKEGAWIVSGEEKVRVDAVVVDHAVDTTGAGDLWAAGFLYGWTQNAPLAACGKMGAVLGAEVVKIIGAAIPEDIWPSLRKQLTDLGA